MIWELFFLFFRAVKKTVSAMCTFCWPSCRLHSSTNTQAGKNPTTTPPQLHCNALEKESAFQFYLGKNILSNIGGKKCLSFS